MNGRSLNIAGLTVRGIALASAVLPAAVPAPAQIPCYQVSATIQGPSCRILGDSITVGTAINSHGHVTGYWNCPGGGAYRPFIWTPETGLVTLTLPPWLLEAIPSDINDNGWICGTGVGPVTGQVGWVRTDAGEWIELQSLSPPNGRSGANAINNNNVVCGFRSIDDGGDPTYPWTAFIWAQDKGFTDLGLVNNGATQARDMNDAGWVTGTMLDAAFEVNVPFLWRADELISIGALVPGQSTTPLAINGQTHVVGSAVVVGLGSRGFLWDGAQMHQLDPLPGHTRCNALEIGDDGIIGGVSRLEVGNNKAVLWDERGIVDVSTRVLLPSELLLTSVSDIGPQGMVLVVNESDSDPSIKSLILQPLSRSQGDINDDCWTDIDDLLMVINEWGQQASPADINDDGVVNIHDLLIVVQNWTY